ncbi:YSIRK-targeted surface antigen transcriptional regulator [Bacillus pakistanensis]|uniref:YSIRK-targeted surface antigen transcriptional regulator n=1 Tax=Rossellomorea pakistanensis TaxID=992288 RepID=A0ABS2NJ46_9BACI|nr:helix-turn-helix domain-containing protein [Bacillus pakistanensis]MBM7587853.1 YSIRK-targeted surface antigen transcriptional regulator [Bacillus pakistanensis]
MEISKTDLPYIGQLIYETHHISVFYINQVGEFEYEFSASVFQKNPFYTSLKEQISRYPYQDDPNNYPIFTSNSDMDFFYINIKRNDDFLGTMIIGPSLQSEISDEKIKRIMNALKENINKRNLIEIYQLLPVIPKQSLLSISLLVYYLIYHQKLDRSMVIEHNKELETFRIQMENPELELSKGRRNFIFHSNLSYERVLLDYVKNGHVEKLKDFIDYSIVGNAELGLLSKRSRLRSEKNLMITGVALVCRAAIEGGLNEETAFTLSDFYIQQLEELERLKDILALIEEAIYDFTNRVSQLNEQKYSATITACQKYIYNHLYGEITLDQLAEITHLSPNYLSSLFKKEVGITISEYIQRQKIDEAKKLLTITNYSISDIGTWLNFYDQSYFIKIFKKFTGLTPKKYRGEQG